MRTVKASRYRTRVSMHREYPAATVSDRVMQCRNFNKKEDTWRETLRHFDAGSRFNPRGIRGGGDMEDVSRNPTAIRTC